MVTWLTPEFREAYNNVISDQLPRGFIDAVSNDDTMFGHYIPHHAVYENSPTTPIRVVYNSSCKQGDNPSLN